MSTSEAQRPDVERAFAHLALCLTPAPDADPISAMRDGVDQYGDVEPRKPITGVTFAPADTGAFKAEWACAPEANPDHRIVYLHGGGWIAGSLYSHRPIVARIAQRSGCVVLAVDYRLAPEHPFPAGLDDSISAIRFAAANGPKGAQRAAHLMLAGDSAGGNLSAAACIRLIASRDRLPERLALICAVLDASPSGATGIADPSVDAAGIAGMMALYAPEVTKLETVDLSPVRAPVDVLRQFPDTLLQASAVEYLLPHAQRFMNKLSAAGARSTLSVWPEMPHVWHAFLELLPEAGAAIDEIADFLKPSR